MELSLPQTMLARHAIEWSFVPQTLTDRLPTMLVDAQDYLHLAETQQARLLRPLDIDPRYLTAFAESGGSYRDFFEAQGRYLPWYGEESHRALVVQDVALVNDGIRKLRKILGLWTSEEAALASDYALSPFSSVVDLNGAFGALSAFSRDLMGTFSDCPLTGLGHFYDAQRRNRLPQFSRLGRRTSAPPPTSRRGVVQGDPA